jgi:hypothetical protein
MNNYGCVWIAVGLLALAFFPLYVYFFFHLVILDLKGEAVATDLNSRGAFQMKSVVWNSEDDVRREVQKLYGSKRFIFPVALVVAFNLICFSVVWDIIHLKCNQGSAPSTYFYGREFLLAAELPSVGFIGVTIFNYGHLLRRLYLWDLTPHVYWNAIHRVWLVIAVAFVISASSSFGVMENAKDASTYIVFFSLGFIINSTLLKLIEQSQKYFKFSRLRVDELPLSMIQGINFWHEYRLEEEGIENVQNLATCDVLELAISTRYNLRTLLDWVDQAILVHRLGKQALKLQSEGLISGAIDMAWASPQNSGGDYQLPNQVAKTLKVAPIYVAALMNSLFEDAHVLMIWDLWQSKEHSQKKREADVVANR